MLNESTKEWPGSISGFTRIYHILITTWWLSSIKELSVIWIIGHPYMFCGVRMLFAMWICVIQIFWLFKAGTGSGCFDHPYIEHAGTKRIKLLSNCVDIIINRPLHYVKQKVASFKRTWLANQMLYVFWQL